MYERKNMSFLKMFSKFFFFFLLEEKKEKILLINWYLIRI